MNQKPRPRSAFIITRAMWINIIGVGLLFFFALFGLLIYFENTEIASLTQIFRVPFVGFHDLDTYELSLFFTFFVFLQFWNMFNARAFASHGSALNLRGCGEFLLIALLICLGQWVIIEFGGAFFGVEPIKITDWIIIICSTSVVLWVGEIYRLIKK